METVTCPRCKEESDMASWSTKDDGVTVICPNCNNASTPEEVAGIGPYILGIGLALLVVVGVVILTLA